MAVTAKQIAEQLNLSPAAVSMALNGRPGVSAGTRRRVLETARALGYDVGRHAAAGKRAGEIAFLFYEPYDTHGIFDSSFFEVLTAAVEGVLKKTAYRLVIHHLNDPDMIPARLRELENAGCDGVILLGTEMQEAEFAAFAGLKLPLVLLDVALDTTHTDCIVINNNDGACMAVELLIRQCHSQPGYLRSAYFIRNFDERADGFYRALRSNGLSAGASQVHLLSPSADGAYRDMLALLENGVIPARCYFADNDMIAIGAMRALKEKGYRIPRDVAVIGFDNIAFCSFVDPPLTTVNVPNHYMGRLAAERLLARIQEPGLLPVKIAVGTSLIERETV